jgi:hypothetical protein
VHRGFSLRLWLFALADQFVEVNKLMAPTRAASGKLVTNLHTTSATLRLLPTPTYWSGLAFGSTLINNFNALFIE